MSILLYLKRVLNKRTFKIIIGGILFVLILENMIAFKDRQFYEIYKDIRNIEGFGIVCECSNESEYYYNYVVQLMELKIDKMQQNHSNRVGKYKNTKIIIRVSKKKNMKLKYGDLVYFNGEFNFATQRSNYKQFSYFDYLKEKNIYGICKCDETTIVKEKRYNSCRMLLENTKNKMRSNLNNTIDKEFVGMARALLLGDSSAIQENQKEVFSNANLSHILAISGMHISYIITACSVCLKGVGNRKTKYILIIFLIIFAIFIGGSPSVIRATAMSILLIVSKLVHRKSDALNNIFIAGFIILLINPYYLFNLGFQLSFGGTLGIILFNESIQRKFENLLKFNNKLLKKVIQIVSVSISANILIFPIVIYNFNSLSAVFIVSNLIITPILGIIICTGYLTVFSSIISINISKVFGVAFNILLKIFYSIALASEKMSFLRYTISTPKVYTIICIYAIIFFIFYSSKTMKSKIFLIIVLIITLIFPRPFFIKNMYLTIHFIDVGQGDCTLIITRENKKILIDGGGSEAGDYNIGKKFLKPYLLDRQIQVLDYVIFSHFDSDHAQGLIYITNELKVKNIIIGKQFEDSENYIELMKIANKKGIKIITLEANQRIQVEKDTYINALWPDSDNKISQNVLNNNSLVCKFCYKEFDILFAGDIEVPAERAILEKYKNNLGLLSATVLKVAHHGSKTSSSNEFIEAVEPKLALIGVGKDNKFGHPAKSTVENLEKLNCVVCRTDNDGEITIKIDSKGYIKEVKKNLQKMYKFL